MTKEEKLSISLSKIEQALKGRLMRDGVNHEEGGLNRYPDLDKIKEDIEEAFFLLKECIR